mgnify:CR=1 FL=1|jgi:hypothetical protein|tara:strand:- start:342 stop:1049 length:708 start_codon:yes stop_codon:yes gene_type:complete
MAKPLVRLQNDATATGDSKITSRNSGGSNTVAMANSDSAKQPLHKTMGTNAKLSNVASSTSFDGSDYFDLASAIEFSSSDTWVWVFSFVDMDTTTDCILAYSSDNGGYIGVEAGGNGILWRNNSSRASETTIATNNTDNSSISYSFGTDVEVLIVTSAAGNNLINFYNIDGALIATNGAAAGACTTWNLDRIGANSSTSTEFVGEILAADFYTDIDIPSASEIVAIGNNYKNLKN